MYQTTFGNWPNSQHPESKYKHQFHLLFLVHLQVINYWHWEEQNDDVCCDRVASISIPVRGDADTGPGGGFVPSAYDGSALENRGYSRSNEVCGYDCNHYPAGNAEKLLLKKDSEV